MNKVAEQICINMIVWIITILGLSLIDHFINELMTMQSMEHMRYKISEKYILRQNQSDSDDFIENWKFVMSFMEIQNL